MNSPSSLSDLYKMVVDSYVKTYEISDTARDLWLDTTVPVEIKGNTVVLATDSEYKRNTLNELYVANLEKQFKNVLGMPVTIQIIVNEEMPLSAK